MKSCYWCKKEIISGEIIRKDDVCPKCKNDIHSCVNCKFYNEAKHNKCNEPNSEWVGNREKRNHCEYFSLRETSQAIEKKEDARKKLEALFIKDKKQQ